MQGSCADLLGQKSNMVFLKLQKNTHQAKGHSVICSFEYTDTMNMLAASAKPSVQ